MYILYYVYVYKLYINSKSVYIYLYIYGFRIRIRRLLHGQTCMRSCACRALEATRVPTPRRGRIDIVHLIMTDFAPAAHRFTQYKPV
jgi:hypothetical protein